jgi:cell division transport system ATP-binding protein
VIQFRKVFKAYPKGSIALKDVSFRMEKSEFLFLTGHSGAGKSTVLRLVYADESPSDGDVLVAGRLLSHLKHSEIPQLRRRLGIVFQDFRLLEDRTAEENVAFALEVTGTRPSIVASKVMRVLTQVGLAAKTHLYPNDPVVLLADEPTGNLDERATRGVFRLLRDINATGTAVVMATHDLDLVRSTSYRTIELRDGAVVHDSGARDSLGEAS